MAITLTQADFKGIGEVAKHCDNEKLDIAIQEAIEFDLKPILCNLFGRVSANWNQEDGIWKDIISPKEYDNCAGYETSHVGLRKILVFYAYSRYVILANFNDTPNGQVTKTNTFSIPKPLQELKQYSNKYRSMASESFKLVEAYIFKNKGDYEGFDYSGLKSCGCNGTCGKENKTKGFGLRSKNIRR